jgi:hypothetical protein
MLSWNQAQILGCMMFIDLHDGIFFAGSKYLKYISSMMMKHNENINWT